VHLAQMTTLFSLTKMKGGWMLGLTEVRVSADTSHLLTRA